MKKPRRKSASRAHAPAAPRYFPSAPLGGMALPFSEAVAMGNTLYVSGQIGNLPGRLRLAAGGIEPETRQMFANIQAILERHGSSLDRVMKCTVFLADIKEWPAFNAIYREFFPTRLPARSALGASGLALEARVEMECIACVPNPRGKRPRQR
ncbi:MAG TPA: RidA family protein [Opitutus sp.]|nr:RidA family protein [Opitutus sp.]